MTGLNSYKSGNRKLVEVLSSWGIWLYAGVNGGGVIHVARHLEPFEGIYQVYDKYKRPRLFDVPEHIAGYVPLGYYLTSGKMAACLLTTGGATLLGLNGLSDAKLHDIPAVYLMALNPTTTYGRGPLQDSTPDGINSAGVVKEILGNGCLVIDDIKKLEEVLYKGQEILQQSKPVAFLFHPDVLSQKTDDFEVPWCEKPRHVNLHDLEMFLREFPREIEGKRVVLYVGEEATRYSGMRELTTTLSSMLKAPTIYSMNGVNAVSPDNPYVAGYIHLGFNDWTKQFWDSLTTKDIVVTLGFDPGEYELNMSKVPANVWHFTNWSNPYGSRNGNFGHRVEGRCRQVRGNLELALERLLPELKSRIKDRPDPEIPHNLNTRTIKKPTDPRHVDLAEFYEIFKELIQLEEERETVIINDVCQAYKDFQYVTQRPIPRTRVFSAHRGSVMGHSFGMGIGAKLATPNNNVHVFAGDGCFAYFAGALGRGKDLGLQLWIINNGGYHIVDKGLDIVMPDERRERHHSILPRSNISGMALMQGWFDDRVPPNLTNLKRMMKKRIRDPTYIKRSFRSVIVDLQVDRDIVIGQNPRLLNLQTNL